MVHIQVVEQDATNRVYHPCNPTVQQHHIMTMMAHIAQQGGQILPFAGKGKKTPKEGKGRKRKKDSL
jgi:hypothetical protein